MHFAGFPEIFAGFPEISWGLHYHFPGYQSFVFFREREPHYMLLFPPLKFNSIL